LARGVELSTLDCGGAGFGGAEPESASKKVLAAATETATGDGLAGGGASRFSSPFGAGTAASGLASSGTGAVGGFNGGAVSAFAMAAGAGSALAGAEGPSAGLSATTIGPASGFPSSGAG
jgi:hypothetical protein